MGVTATANLVMKQADNESAQSEYEMLRQYAPDIHSANRPPGTQAESEPNSGSGSGSMQEQSLSEINRDYIGWLCVEGTVMDYPVVRGYDNIKYLDVTFSGEKNASGTIFMDYRSSDNFNSTFTILYGHNMRSGTMFADVARYLQDGYLAEHPVITVVTADGESLDYKIFNIKFTDENDEAYSLVGNHVENRAIWDYLNTLAVPDRGSRVIALSTCTSSSNKERLLLFAIA